MLNPAEVSLAVRDPALPGLRLLLDNERLGEWLSDLLGREVVIRRRHLRYKPGTSCVLHAEGAGQPLLVSAYRPADSAKLGKTCKQAPAGTVVGVDVPLGVLVSTLAADRDLVALAVLPDESRRQLLLDRMLGEGAVLPGAEPEMLRYKPHRRWVGLLPTTSGPVLLRAYRRTAITSAAQAVSRLQDGAPRTPRLLGWDRRLGLAAVEFLAGRPAHDPTVADTTAYADAAVFGRVGAALARLHQRSGVRLPERRPAADIAAVCAATEHLSVLLPELARSVTRLADRIAEGLNRVDPPPVLVHGDFSADQAVVHRDGQVALIDLDSAVLGDPAADLGCAAAAMARDVVLGELTEPARTDRLVALHAGYREAGGLLDSDRMRWHDAAHLLRRAAEPFRLGLTTDWPQAARDLVQAADSALSEPALSEPALSEPALSEPVRSKPSMGRN